MFPDILQEENHIAQGWNATAFCRLLFQFMSAQDPMLSILERLCSQKMTEAVVFNKLETEKHGQRKKRINSAAASCHGVWIPYWV